MKEYFTVISLVLFVLSSQLVAGSDLSIKKEDMRLLKLYYVNSHGEKGVTIFNYNNKGYKYKALWYLTNGKRNSLNFYNYDRNGKLIKKYREFSDKKRSTQTFKYNSAGKLIFEDFKRSDGVKGFAVYKYDNSGRLIRSECRGLNGWFYGVIYYKYGSDGSRTGAVITQEEVNKGEITYTYSKAGLLMKEHWDFTGKWDQTFQYEYERSDKRINLPFTSSNPFINTKSGYRIAHEEYDYSGKSGGPSDYEYCGKKLEKKIFTRSDGLKTETFYFYNINNELIRSLRRYADGRSAVFTYSHNKDRQLVKRSGIGTAGFRSEENYSYDDRGKLIKADWGNFDNWLTGSINFKHNSEGGLFSGEFESKGEKKFNAGIEFKYDQYKNLLSIYWKFSFPGAQTYTFDYVKN